MLIASANPEDYTNRGRIITPLKDRYGAQIRTHYPRNLHEEIEIMEQEHTRFEDSDRVVEIPQYMKEIVAEITSLARRSPEINQRSGVSLRVSIANYETVIGSAFKRSLRLDEVASPRVSDLPAVVASTNGKVEMESAEEGREFKVVDSLVKKAVQNTFGRYFSVREFDAVLTRFEEGLTIETGSDVPSGDYTKKLPQMANLADLVKRIESSNDPATIASAIEFVLEGLHLSRRLISPKSPPEPRPDRGPPHHILCLGALRPSPTLRRLVRFTNPTFPFRRRAPPRQHALAASGPLRLADLPSVPDEVHVERKNVLGRNHRLQDVVRLVSRHLGTYEPQTLRNPVNVGIYRHRGHPQREAQDYGRRLGTDPGQTLQPRLRLFKLHFAQESSDRTSQARP